MQMGQHWMFLTVCGFALAGALGYVIWWAYGRLTTWGTKYRYRYFKIPTLSPRLSSPTRRTRGVMPTLLRRVSLKEDEEAVALTETSHELYSRRD